MANFRIFFMFSTAGNQDLPNLPTSTSSYRLFTPMGYLCCHSLHQHCLWINTHFYYSWLLLNELSISWANLYGTFQQSHQRHTKTMVCREGKAHLCFCPYRLVLTIIDVCLLQTTLHFIETSFQMAVKLVDSIEKKQYFKAQVKLGWLVDGSHLHFNWHKLGVCFCVY